MATPSTPGPRSPATTRQTRRTQPAQAETATKETPAAAPARAETATETAKQPRTATLDLPFVTAQFRAPDLHLPQVHVPSPRLSREELGSAVQTARSYLPPPRELAYYGGLAALAAFEVIEWPVAVAIGIGAAVFGRRAQGRDRQPASSTDAR
jgi:hypothetical protein